MSEKPKEQQEVELTFAMPISLSEEMEQIAAKHSITVEEVAIRIIETELEKYAEQEKQGRIPLIRPCDV